MNMHKVCVAVELGWKCVVVEAVRQPLLKSPTRRVITKVVQYIEKQSCLAVKSAMEKIKMNVCIHLSLWAKASKGDHLENLANSKEK
jgi:hypothetical protein